MKPTIIQRQVDEQTLQQLSSQGLSPILAKVYAARGVHQLSDVDHAIAGLLPPDGLKGLPEMACYLADAIEAGKSIIVIGDYDADGATASAVAVRGLNMMGARVDFLVPNRFEYGYGLTPEIVDLAAQKQPDVLLTVDNGIASLAGVDRANALGIDVLVTDHHLPGERLPNATSIVNPNQPDCPFASKHLAGVGVMFYVLMGLRAEMRKRGRFLGHTEPNLSTLLDIVALGTVADVVKLDKNNRILVEQGLSRIRNGKACAGIRALIQVSGRQAERLMAQDLGFSLGPRLNAAGRLDDMSLGIRCLITDNPDEALALASELNGLNQARKQIEVDMQEEAMAILERVDPSENFTISLFHPEWHQGVIGILASRIKDKFHRPTIVFAEAGDGTLKGSGRSISALHLRDALDLVSKRAPDLIQKFGGHAMAAGLTIMAKDFDAFSQIFEKVVSDLITQNELAAVLEVDGSASEGEMTLTLAEQFEQTVWGQGFPPPLFYDHFDIVEQRIVGERHLKLRVATQTSPQKLYDAIYFGCATPFTSAIQMVYQPQTNRYNGNTSLQLLVRYAEHV